MITKTNTLDLAYIYNISDHDREFIKEMLVTFLKITPASLDDIQKAQTAKNWKEVGRLAHKIKPTLMLIGNDDLSKKIKKLELEAKQESNVKNIHSLVSEIDGQCRQTVSEIQELIDTDRY